MKGKNEAFDEKNVRKTMPSGIKVMKTEPPSQEACERFIRVIMELKAKYNIE
ncbi:MAG TPA: hypothetical protein VF149_02355 [Bacillales bacterium]